MTFKSKYRAKDTEIAVEIGGIIVCLTLYLILLRGPLFYGTTTLTHDNFYWLYPAFQFIAESLLTNSLPLWNPFSHSGEPFYITLIGMRLMEPLLPLCVWIGKLFSTDALVLFNWYRTLLNLVMVTGVYLVLRKVADRPITRLALIIILFFSSFQLISFRQDGVIHHFLWTPYLWLAFHRLVFQKAQGFFPWALFSVLVGINFQGHFFSGTSLFLLTLLIGGLLLHRQAMRDLIRREAIPKVVLSVIILGIMALPNLVTLIEMGSVVFPVRFVPPDQANNLPLRGPVQYEGDASFDLTGAELTYSSLTHTGTFARLWDFIYMAFPGTSPFSKQIKVTESARPSEAYMYMGLLPWAIALWGLFFGNHPLRRLWALVLFVYGLILLGPMGGLHRVLYSLFLPLRFTRHTSMYVLYFQFALLYFFTLGMDQWAKKWERWSTSEA